MDERYSVIITCEREFKDESGNVIGICGKTVPQGKDNRYYVRSLKRNIHLCPTCAGEFHRKELNSAMRARRSLLRTFGDFIPLWNLLGIDTDVVNRETGDILPTSYLYRNRAGQVEVLKVAAVNEKGVPLDDEGRPIFRGRINLVSQFIKDGRWRTARFQAGSMVGQARLELLRMMDAEIDQVLGILMPAYKAGKDQRLRQQIDAYWKISKDGVVEAFKGDLDIFKRSLIVLERASADIEQAHNEDRESPTKALGAVVGPIGVNAYKAIRPVFTALVELARKKHLPVPQRTASLAERLLGTGYEMDVIEEVEEEEPEKKAVTVEPPKAAATPEEGKKKAKRKKSG